MKGDTIVVEDHHRRAAEAIVPMLRPILDGSDQRFAMTVAGESGSGKSETATAIADLLAAEKIKSQIFQQDDYFVYPPKSNDRKRRETITWVGPQEVRLDLLDQHLAGFLAGDKTIEKPLVIYEDDTISSEIIEPGNARVAIAEGTYTTLLDQPSVKVFIDRDYRETRAHREKRMRDASELDPFIDQVLTIEHEIISAHKALATIIVASDYSVSLVE